MTTKTETATTPIDHTECKLDACLVADAAFAAASLGGRDKASTVSAASLTARECYNRLRRCQAPQRHSLYLSREPSPRHPSACVRVLRSLRSDGGRGAGSHFGPMPGGSASTSHPVPDRARLPTPGGITDWWCRFCVFCLFPKGLATFATLATGGWTRCRGRARPEAVGGTVRGLT